MKNALNDSESEAAETQTWVELACRCGYWSNQEAQEFDQRCEHILGQLAKMIADAPRWCSRPD
jgi:four helix bundle protein